MPVCTVRGSGKCWSLRKRMGGESSLSVHTRHGILAQVWHAVSEESALTVSDFLLRRSAAGLERCHGLDAMEGVATEMGRLLSWDDKERQQQMTEYRDAAALGQRFRTGG